MSSLFIPKAHQIDASHFHRKTGPYLGWPQMMGTLLWHGMGLGKTVESLIEAQEVITSLRKAGVVSPKFMVIVPKSAVPTWKAECMKFTPGIYRDMVIYPYSQLHHAKKNLQYMDVRMLVFDESHYLKSPETDRIQVLADFLEAIHQKNGFKGGRIIAATGTTMPNGAQELYTSWALCCAPDLMETAKRLRDMKRYENWKYSFSKKKQKKFERGRGKYKREEIKHTWEGVENEDLLQKLLSPFVHFRRVEDCLDLPEKREIPYDLAIPDDRLLKDANIEEPEAYMALLEKLARAKTPYMLDWIDDYLKGCDEPLIVFAMYRFPIEELQQKFGKHVRLITGAESGQIRAQNLADFQAGKYRILAMTFKAGAESLNLQNCRTTLYHGYPWTNDTLKQAMARTYRQGQRNMTLHHFLTSGENDMRILDIVLRKAAATRTVEDLLLRAQGVPMSVDVRTITVDDLI